MLAAKNVAHTASRTTSQRVERTDESDARRRGSTTHQRSRPAGSGGPGGRRSRAATDPPVAVDLAEEQLGDQEAGDHEEDVDPDEAAGQERDAGVTGDHGQHGDRPQALDVGAERRRFGSGGAARTSASHRLPLHDRLSREQASKVGRPSRIGNFSARPGVETGDGVTRLEPRLAIRQVDESIGLQGGDHAEQQPGVPTFRGVQPDRRRPDVRRLRRALHLVDRSVVRPATQAPHRSRRHRPR